MLLLASLEGRVFLLSERCGPLTFLKPRFVFSSFTCFFVQKYSTSEINFCIYHELGFKKCVCVCVRGSRVSQRTWSSLELDWLPGKPSGSSCLSPLVPELQMSQCLWLLPGAMDPSSGPCAWTTSTLPSEPASLLGLGFGF